DRCRVGELAHVGEGVRLRGVDDGELEHVFPVPDEYPAEVPHGPPRRLLGVLRVTRLGEARVEGVPVRFRLDPRTRRILSDLVEDAPDACKVQLRRVTEWGAAEFPVDEVFGAVAAGEEDIRG